MNFNTVKLTPEFSLLLQLSRHDPSEINFPLKEVKQLINECDISLFLKKLNQARTWPVVYLNVKRHSIQLPNHAFVLLKKRAEQIVIQNLTHHRLLMQIKKAFKKEGIPAISMKGTLLAERLMSNISLRHSKDIDLLVPAQQFERAAAELEKLGYECCDISHFGVSEFNLLQKVTHHSVFHHQQTNFQIELHWQPCNLTDVMSFSKQFWHSELQKKASNCQLLPDEELLLYLCAHGSIHLWNRLKWLVDIEQLLTQNDWDWPQLLNKAFEYNCERSLALGVLLVHQLYAVPLPQEIKHYLQAHPVVEALAKKTIELAFNADYYSSKSPIVLLWLAINASWYRIMLLSNYSLKAKWVAEMLFPRLEDIQVVSLPSHLFFIYYLIRPVRIIYDIFIHLSQKTISAFISVLI